MKTFKKFVLICVLFSSFVGFSQDRSVQGTVLDGAFGDEPLAFASVSVKGIDIETQTSIDGSFELTLLEGNYTLIVDFIGYDPVEISHVAVANKNLILKPVVLKAARPSLDLVTASNGQ